MSVLIEGIEMPKAADEYYLLSIYPDGYVFVSFYQGDNTIRTERTAIAVPTPHGRLIDADKLSNFIPSEEINSRVALHYMPTVIEREE